MTSERHFDRDLPDLLAELYPATVPDYRDDLFRQTAATRQRPAWSFLQRYIPMDIASRRVPFAPVPWRALGIVALILVLAAAALIVGAGSQRRVPPPFGLARTGPIAYTRADAIYTRDSIAAPERLLIAADGGKVGFWGFSRDGRHVLFQRTEQGYDYLMAADANGANARRILDGALDNAYAAIGADGRTVAVATGQPGLRKVFLAHYDGSPATEVDLSSFNPAGYGQLNATDLAWRPPNGDELLIRASALDSTVDFYRVKSDGTPIGRLHIPDPMTFGPDWSVSGPQWSPTGAILAYNQVEKYGTKGDAHFRVHLVNPDGTGDIELPAPADPTINQAWPIWSPDGRWIAVQRFIFGDPEQGWLAILPSDGSNAGRDIIPRMFGVGGIVKTWSPDGTRVLAHTDTTGETMSIDPQSGQVDKVDWSAADLPDFQRLAP